MSAIEAMRYDGRVVESHATRCLPELVQIVKRLELDNAIDFASATVHRVEDWEKTCTKNEENRTVMNQVKRTIGLDEFLREWWRTHRSA